MKRTLKVTSLSLGSALLLWMAWPPHALGFMALIGFVPLLFLQQWHADKKIKTRTYRWHIYLSLLSWNVLTTWWVWYASEWGSIAAMVLNALFMSVVWWLFDTLQRKRSNGIGYVFLLSFWLAYELFHLNWEITWPWLVLGNVFANNTLLVQWYEFTGHLGGSLWVMLVNILVFQTLQRYIMHDVRFRRSAMQLSVSVLLPVLISLSVYAYRSTQRKEGSPFQALLIQPNLDPYTEKFSDDGQALTPQQQLERMLQMAEEKITDSTSFVLFPETALQGSLMEKVIDREFLVERIREFLQKHPHACVVSGADTYTTYEDKATETARKARNSDVYIDFFNTALKIDTSALVEIYHKSRLVPGVERMPYPKIFGFLEDYAISLGGTSGSLGTQKEASVFTHDGIKAAPLICYESVFGGYVKEFVSRGAQVLMVVTNDGWWGNTDGYKQHISYGRLRAIEFRMPLLQCANTGISAGIDALGDYTQRSHWWKQESMLLNVNACHEQTLYARFGDWVGWLGVAGSVMALVAFFLTRKKPNP